MRGEVTKETGEYSGNENRLVAFCHLMFAVGVVCYTEMCQGMYI